MRFFGRLKATSHIHKSWMMGSRIGGNISGIQFRLTDGFFVSDELTSEQVDMVKARGDQAIQLEMISIMPETVVKRHRLKTH